MKKPIFLTIQGCYSDLEVALFKGDFILDSFKENNLKASSVLVPKIADLLKRNFLELHDLDFISTVKGPGAFTSLRVVITVVNGFSFASKIPLIGIDGLEVLYYQTKDSLDDINNKNIVVLLNAYNNDVYFAFYKNGFLQKGYKKIDLLVSELKEFYKETEIIFVGNAYEQHKNLISNNLNHYYIEKKVPSIAQLAKMSLKHWDLNKDLSFKLMPLYLKSQNFAIAF